MDVLHQLLNKIQTNNSFFVSKKDQDLFFTTFKDDLNKGVVQDNHIVFKHEYHLQIEFIHCLERIIWFWKLSSPRKPENEEQNICTIFLVTELFLKYFFKLCQKYKVSEDTISLSKLLFALSKKNHENFGEGNEIFEIVMHPGKLTKISQKIKTGLISLFEPLLLNEDKKTFREVSIYCCENDLKKVNDGLFLDDEQQQQQGFMTINDRFYTMLREFLGKLLKDDKISLGNSQKTLQLYKLFIETYLKNSNGNVKIKNLGNGFKTLFLDEAIQGKKRITENNLDKTTKRNKSGNIGASSSSSSNEIPRIPFGDSNFAPDEFVRLESIAYNANGPPVIHRPPPSSPMDLFQSQLDEFPTISEEQSNDLFGDQL